MRQAPAPSTSATSRRTVLLPTSMAQRRMAERDDAPPEAPAGRLDIERCRLLPLQGSNVVHDLPALVLRQMLPRRHRAAAVRHLPEDLTIGLLLDRIGRPVRRLRRGQCRGGRAVALAAGTVAGDAVRLDCLLRVTDALDRILRRLRFTRRSPPQTGAQPAPIGDR